MKSGLRRAITSIAIASVSGCLLFGGVTAEAHPGDSHETDEQHAAQDLAGVPMATIEKTTRANAAKIKKATGAVPGRRTAGQRDAGQRVAVTRRSRPERSVERGAGHPGGAGLPGGPAQRQGLDVGLGRRQSGRQLSGPHLHPSHRLGSPDRHLPPGECLRLQHLLCRLRPAGGRTRAGRRWQSRTRSRTASCRPTSSTGVPKPGRGVRT